MRYQGGLILPSKLPSKGWFYRNDLRQMLKTNICFKAMLSKCINNICHQILALQYEIIYFYVYIQFYCWLHVGPITSHSAVFKVVLDFSRII